MHNKAYERGEIRLPSVENAMETPWNWEGEKEKIVKMSTADLDEAGFFL